VLSLLKVIMLLCFVVLHGCAKYKGWEDVEIEPTAVGKSCVLLGKRESCKSNLAICNTWFKKRATGVKANTVVLTEIYNSNFMGRYYNCEAGLPLYEKVKFTMEGYTNGVSDLTGQAFLIQRGGDVVTCAGKMVVLYPNNNFFNTKRSGDKETEDSDEALSMEFVTQCDAGGNFEFYNVPNGLWTIETAVTWDVPEAVNVGMGMYFIAANKQGGNMKKNVWVKPNVKNRFIISQ